MISILFLCVTISAFELQDHRRQTDPTHPTNDCGRFTSIFNPTQCTSPSTTGCRCKCLPGTGGYLGWDGISNSEHNCGSTTLPGTFLVTTGPYAQSDCWKHCDVNLYLELCNNNRGVPGTVCTNTDAAQEIYDVQTRFESCVCQAGWYSYNGAGFQPNAQLEGFGNTGSTGGAPRHCIFTFRATVCNGHGRDNTGPEAGEGSCPDGSLPNSSPGAKCPPGAVTDYYPGCGRSYPSTSNPFGGSSGQNFRCSCDPGWGGFGSLGNQCGVNIRDSLCHGNGADSLPQRRLSDFNQQDIVCTCDPGWDPDTTCAVYIPCKTFHCGAQATPPRGQCTTSGLTCSRLPDDNPEGTCCQCNAGYGGSYCCPLKFGTTTGETCNGIGSCNYDGQCSCGGGTQAPGCCTGCDPSSQACLPDGRCACPVLAGDSCGSHGVCNTNTQACTCGTASVDIDGSSGPLSNFTVTYGGKYCCPIILGTVCGTGGTCTSTVDATDPNGPTGTCSCGPGAPGYTLTGRFCCPKTSSQSKECGSVGFCAVNGTCICPKGYAGPACETNRNCQPHIASECNGAGVCSLDTEGIGSYLKNLRFDNNPTLGYITTDNVNFTDEGVIDLIKRYSRAFVGFDPHDRNPESIYYTQNISSCNAVASQGRGACLLNALTKCHAQREVYIDSLGPSFRADMRTYVAQVFRVLHPTRTLPFTIQFTQQVADALAAACTSGQAKEAIASLMLWEEWIHRYPGALIDQSGIQMLPTTAIPGYPYQCRCTTPIGSIGIDTYPGGMFCDLDCPIGTPPDKGSDPQICSGYSYGIHRGTCITDGINAPKCECGRKFKGKACQQDLALRCFADGSTDSEPCSNHGSCTQTAGNSESSSQNANFVCNCSSTYNGNYCELSRCVAPGLPLTALTECSTYGVCQTNLQCDCTNGRTQLFKDQCNSNIRPLIPAGTACEKNASLACGTFHSGSNPDKSNPGCSLGHWRSCSGRGTCDWNYNTQSASCACESGYFGPQCEFSACTDCNLHQTCNNATGQCGCFPFWTTPSSCTAGNRTCECSVNRCLHGTPVTDGTSCICDAGWKKTKTGINAGICNVVQCSLVVVSDQGVRKCESTDTICPNVDDTTQQGCCVDICPTCSLNTTSNVRTCDCTQLQGAGPCYTHSNEICFPVCHGNGNCDSTSCQQGSPCSPPTLSCDCTHITLQTNQFVDLTCNRFSCGVGTRKSNPCIPQQQTCCDCSQTAFTGAFCATSACGDRGVPTNNGSFCVCTPPFMRSVTSRICDTDTCTPGTVVSTAGMNPPSQLPFLCNCPGNTFIGANNLSCTTLDCLGQHASLCSVCIHGQAVLVNRQVQCDCTNTNYTGVDCNTAVCRNGGTTNPSSPTTCLCQFPFTGSFCLSHLCLHGGIPTTGLCSCSSLWTGSRCEIAVAPPPSSSTAAAASSSSSSTASSSSSTATVPATAVAEASPVLSTGAIIGISVGGVAIVGLVGVGVYLATATSSSAAAAAAAAKATTNTGIELATMRATPETTSQTTRLVVMDDGL